VKFNGEKESDSLRLVTTETTDSFDDVINQKHNQKCPNHIQSLISRNRPPHNKKSFAEDSIQDSPIFIKCSPPKQDNINQVIGINLTLKDTSNHI